MMPLFIKWTPTDDALLLAEAAAGITFGTLGEHFKCDKNSARNRYLLLLARMDPKQREAAIQSRDEHLKLPQRLKVSAEQLADRDARSRAKHRDLAGAVFGDPLPGRSALDRRVSP